MIDKYFNTMLILLIFVTLLGCATDKNLPLAAQQQKILDLNERALASAEKKNHTDASKLLEDALRIASSLDDQESQIITLLNMSRIARHEKKMSEASKFISKAFQIKTDSPLYADMAQEKALQELNSGNIDKAVLWAETALSNEQGKLIGRRLNLMARIYLIKGDLTTALDYAELALKSNTIPLLKEERGNSLRILGTVKTRGLQFEDAEKLLQEALTLDRQMAISTKIAADLDALADLAGMQNNNIKKEEYLKRAESVRKNQMSVNVPYKTQIP